MSNLPPQPPDFDVDPEDADAESAMAGADADPEDADAESLRASADAGSEDAGSEAADAEDADAESAMASAEADPKDTDPGATSTESDGTTADRGPEAISGDRSPASAKSRGLRQGTIALLYWTIQRLQNWVDQLEAIEAGVDLDTAALPADRPQPEGWIDRVVLWWRRQLLQIRRWLPANTSRQLSDSGLTAIVALVVAALIGSGSLLISGPKNPETVATRPPGMQTPEPERGTENQPPMGTTPSPQDTSPPQEPSQTSESVPAPETSRQEPAEPSVSGPTPKLAPEPPAIVPEPPPPERIPPDQITDPAQQLIALVQEQVILALPERLPDRGSEQDDRRLTDLVRTVQPDFSQNQLKVEISQDWYDRDRQQQDQLVAALWQQAQDLNFAHLIVTDFQGTVLARSPIVGTTAIVLKRRRSELPKLSS